MFQTESLLWVLLPAVIDFIEILPNQTYIYIYIGSLWWLKKQTLDTHVFIELIPHPPSQTLGCHIYIHHAYATATHITMSDGCTCRAPSKNVRQGLNPRLQHHQIQTMHMPCPKNIIVRQRRDSCCTSSSAKNQTLVVPNKDEFGSGADPVWRV